MVLRGKRSMGFAGGFEPKGPEALGWAVFWRRAGSLRGGGPSGHAAKRLGLNGAAAAAGSTQVEMHETSSANRQTSLYLS